MYKPKITDLSPHLFWDVPVDNVDFAKSRKLIIHRVLDYGLLTDWQILREVYGISEISKTATALRDLDKKSGSFISLLSKVPKEKFLCYTSRPSTPEHAIF